jgi:hypothetical protein
MFYEKNASLSSTQQLMQGGFYVSYIDSNNESEQEEALLS